MPNPETNFLFFFIKWLDNYLKVKKLIFYLNLKPYIVQIWLFYL